LYSVGNLYVQSPSAKLLAQPQANSTGDALAVGESLNPISEEGFFIQVRKGNKTGWVNKLFLSAFPPGGQIKLNSQAEVSDSVQARQRASDFTKTAAARGLSETESLRVRGEGHTYDFESLVWLESNSVETNRTLTMEPVESIPRRKESSSKIPRSSEQEIKVGRSIAAKLIYKYGIVKNKEASIQLNLLGRSISSKTSRTDLPFLFGILNSDEINAFACPGGIILLTKGLIRSVQETSELAGILSHEISHVVLKHSGEFEEMNPILAIISSILAPTGGEIINATTSMAIEQMEKQFLETGRDQKTELEADGAGAMLASMMGYSPGKYEQYLDRISKSPDAIIHSKTHPDYKTRVQQIQKLSASLPKEESKNIEFSLEKVKKAIN
jgi:beta-barrel assembly-enhancing protease